MNRRFTACRNCTQTRSSKLRCWLIPVATRRPSFWRWRRGFAPGFVDLEHGIICDSKSGVSGAGKQPTPEDALRGSGRGLLRLQRFRTSAHGRDAGAARTRRRLVAVHAASAAHSARHPFDHLREAGEVCDCGRVGTGAARVLRRQAVGAGLRRCAPAANQVLGATPTTATSVLRSLPMASGLCWCHASTIF